MNIYSIKNEKLGFFNRPIYCETRSEALSYIMNILCSDADRALFGLKDDLSLYYLGEIEFDTGIIYPASTEVGIREPVFITSLKEIFDSIPEDVISHRASHEEVLSLSKKVYELNASLEKYKELLDSHTHSKKELTK